jgi:hypothetical protein
MPDDLADPVVTAACFSFCRRAMGEAFTRRSLRPLHLRGLHHASLGREVRGENVELYPLFEISMSAKNSLLLVIARSVSDEAIQNPEQDSGLLRFARNDE